MGWLGVDRPDRLPGVDRPGLLDVGRAERHRPGRHGSDAERRPGADHGRHPLGGDHGLRRCAYPAARRRGCYLDVDRPGVGRAGRHRGVEPGSRPSACPAGKRTGCFPDAVRQPASAQALDLASGHRELARQEPRLPAGPAPAGLRVQLAKASVRPWEPHSAWEPRFPASAQCRSSGLPERPWAQPDGMPPAWIGRNRQRHRAVCALPEVPRWRKRNERIRPFPAICSMHL